MIKLFEDYYYYKDYENLRNKINYLKDRIFYFLKNIDILKKDKNLTLETEDTRDKVENISIDYKEGQIRFLNIIFDIENQILDVTEYYGECSDIYWYLRKRLNEQFKILEEDEQGDGNYFEMDLYRINKSKVDSIILSNEDYEIFKDTNKFGL